MTGSDGKTSILRFETLRKHHEDCDCGGLTHRGSYDAEDDATEATFYSVWETACGFHFCDKNRLACTQRFCDCPPKHYATSGCDHLDCAIAYYQAELESRSNQPAWVNNPVLNAIAFLIMLCIPPLWIFILIAIFSKSDSELRASADDLVIFKRTGTYKGMPAKIHPHHTSLFSHR